MTELPIGDEHQVIHLGGEAAVVVPLEEYRQLRQMEQRNRLVEQTDVEEAAALAEYRAQQRADAVKAIPHDEARRRLGLPR